MYSFSAGLIKFKIITRKFSTKFKSHSSFKDSIAVNFSAENATQTEHISLFHRIYEVFSFFHRLSRHLPPILHNDCATKRYLSIPISGHLRRLIRYNAVERFSVELAKRTIEMALAEVLCIQQHYNSYRFYHVFKKVSSRDFEK